MLLAVKVLAGDLVSAIAGVLSQHVQNSRVGVAERACSDVGRKIQKRVSVNIGYGAPAASGYHKRVGKSRVVAVPVYDVDYPLRVRAGRFRNDP
jgi:hypothetical protein